MLDEIFYYRQATIYNCWVSYQYEEQRLRQLVSSSPGLNTPISLLMKFPHTDPKVVKALQEKTKHLALEDQLWNSKLIKVMIDRYQFYNQIIREYFLELGPENLTPANIQWITIAPSVHAYLEGKTDDPGFPDPAYIPSSKEGYFGMLNDGYLFKVFKMEKDLEKPHLKTPSFLRPRKKRESDVQRSDCKEAQSSTTVIQDPAPQLNEILHFSKEEKTEKEIEPVEKATVVDVARPEIPSLPKIEKREFDRPAPRGLRVHHAHVPAPRMTRADIKAQLLSRLNRRDIQWLFDLYYHQMKEVTYSDFRTIWIKLNGNNSIVHSKSGGSHHKLVDSSGKTVGGIFSHGNSQVYYKGFQPYLIESFKMLGIGAELLEELVNT